HEGAGVEVGLRVLGRGVVPAVARVRGADVAQRPDVEAGGAREHLELALLALHAHGLDAELATVLLDVRLGHQHASLMPGRASFWGSPRLAAGGEEGEPPSHPQERPMSFSRMGRTRSGLAPRAPRLAAACSPGTGPTKGRVVTQAADHQAGARGQAPEPLPKRPEDLARGRPPSLTEDPLGFRVDARGP